MPALTPHSQEIFGIVDGDLEFAGVLFMSTLYAALVLYRHTYKITHRCLITVHVFLMLLKLNSSPNFGVSNSAF